MNRLILRLVLPTAAALAGSLAAVPAAQAAPSCVAQSTLAEHQVHGSAWGHEVPAFLASHREVLQQFGFASFGALASYAAAQDPNNCPPDL